MAMNLCHRLCCSSDRYFKAVEDALLPWVLGDVDLGDNVLEIGPGYGANIRVLIDKAPHYTAVEIDQPMAERLKSKYGDRARIINGDGTEHRLARPRSSARWCVSRCCTTFRHAELQDQLFAEAFRVLRPGGVFAGSDSAASTLFSHPAFSRHLQPGVAGHVAGPLARSGF